VARNIATVPALLGWPAARRAARVDELLALFGLEPALYRERYPHQLSGGQQQRVGVARALAADPEVLLMDEPFGALDPIIRGKAQDDLLDIQRRFGTTIILVTHDMDEAFRLGDRVGVMSGGRLLQYDRPEVLITKPADPFVSQLTGSADRALKLLSLTTAGEVAAPGTPGADDLDVAAGASLRDVLAELVWRGATTARVVGAQGQALGRVTLDSILAHGRRAP
jgi:osmoprotectant transport system ATP-binding protein